MNHSWVQTPFQKGTPFLDDICFPSDPGRGTLRSICALQQHHTGYVMPSEGDRDRVENRPHRYGKYLAAFAAYLGVRNLWHRRGQPSEPSDYAP